MHQRDRTSRSSPKAGDLKANLLKGVAHGESQAHKKRKRTDSDQEHEDELERIGKTGAGTKIRKTESVDKRLQQQQQTVTLPTQKRDVPAFLRGPAE